MGGGVTSHESEKGLVIAPNAQLRVLRSKMMPNCVYLLGMCESWFDLVLHSIAGSSNGYGHRVMEQAV